MILIDGKKTAATIEKRIQNDIIKQARNRPPGLAFILVGDNSGSKTYIKMKKRKCAEVGILSFDHELPASTTEEKLLQIIQELNENSSIDGILIQLPLPPHISTLKAMEAIDPNKDVDGFHPFNMGKLLLGEDNTFYPCTPHGVIVLLHDYNIAVAGQHVVIVGRSNIVGKPLAAMLMQKNSLANATVSVVHSATKNIKQICLTADILIVAMGMAHYIDASYIKPNAVVIDVGINRKEGKIVGDVHFESVAKKAAYLTPVPGGVGPMTIAMLLSNTWASYLKNASVG